ncbi:MAG: chemotaxis protein CheW [Gammaproteobacteria bacterium]|nr:chemotaxis protein CheW [Gammaproteobacteria bacterium]MBU1654848.1 chemotaxis protein CheW [Gammaproteobacteria bacterium]MBU1961139.1 chemotaxis protein CheW [Gammaproteobacteria bacterium]
MDAVRAWLLHTSADFYLAVGEPELVEVLARPRTHYVPGAPEQCRQIIVWRDRLLPMVHPAALAGLEGGGEQPVFVAVIAYQEAPGEPLQYGALALADAPVPIQVNAGPPGEPPLAGEVWDRLLLSCFRQEDKSVLVVDMELLFNTNPADLR